MILQRFANLVLTLFMNHDILMLPLQWHTKSPIRGANCVPPSVKRALGGGHEG
jgi:hypothetical protein